MVKWSQYIVTLLLLAGLALVGMVPNPGVTYGALSWIVWLSLFAVLALTVFVRVSLDSSRSQRELTKPLAESDPQLSQSPGQPSTQPIFDKEGPSFPYPVINVQTCIGCHACVDACPHDVLAIVNGKAMPVAIEQCTEDTSCQVECPTVPKSCIVVNTTKKIPARKVPQRDERYKTNVPGVFLIGDVSGVPLIKNAINEGGAVVDFVVDDLQAAGDGNPADYDVAIIGLGPAGLSAAVKAHQRGLKYVALDQEQVLATIQQTYQAGKYVFFNPVEKPADGGIELEGPGGVKEEMIGSWLETVTRNGVAINEYECCKSIRSDSGGFRIATEKESLRETAEYHVRRVILAIGNRGTPMRLRVSGEDLTLSVTPSEPEFPPFCSKCGTKRNEGDHFCQSCGRAYVARLPEPYEDNKVKFKLTDPNLYHEKHVLIVGAGNSAIEAAIDLAAYRSSDGTSITGWRDNHVSLVVRSDFKSDLKLGNKMLVYDCIDAGRIAAYFRMTIKEITVDEVTLMSARERDPKTADESARVRNDYVFAMIGGEKPTTFLESLGINIG